MKLILLTACLPFYALPFCEAADIFTSPPKAVAAETIKYSTSAAFLSATRSGEIPEALQNSDIISPVFEAVGQSVIAILRNEYRVPKPDSGNDIASICGWALSALTKYELAGGQGDELASTFQERRKQLSDGQGGPRFLEAFDSLSKNYARAVKESIVLKQEVQERRLAAEAEKQRQADMATQKAQQERRQTMAVANAKAASIRAEEDMRATAVAEAMAAQAKIHEQKLQEVLASPAYKIWQVSLQLEEGMRIIATGQRILDHDDAVQRESGVVDLSARRAAGERIVAGKRLVDPAFATYKQLGGTALTPGEVRAGSDPAKEYR